MSPSRWSAYRPSASAPWDLARASTLPRRADFAATWDDDLDAMRGQNETFRRHGRGPFGDLLRAMLSDPELLAWLDAPSNRKGKPNENLARELMELFTLGVGHFSEHDVRGVARVLTGRPVGRLARADTPSVPTGTTIRPRPSWGKPTTSMATRSRTCCYGTRAP